MNISENVHFGSKLFPDRDAVRFEGQRLTYGQIDRLSSQAAGVLRERGVTRGDRVGLRLPNVPAFIIWYYAALRLGAVAVSISTRLAPKEVGFILSDCEATALIVDEAAGDEARGELPACVAYVATVSESGEQIDGQPLSRASHLAAPEWIDTEPDEPAVILYTSGTTGFPKGATLSHRNVRATVCAFNHLCEMRGDDRMLLSVPLFHCYGQNALLNAALNVGATLIMQRRFDLNESKRLIAEERITRLFGVPTTFQLLWECCEPAELASVKYCFSAAATLPLDLSQRWQAKFGMPIYEGYGLTETAPFASYNHRVRFKPGSIGTPVDLVEMRIVDTETGLPCPPETPGEIAIRGPNVMLGYWNRPEETADAIRDGWFHSGDIGRMDEEGYFYIVDRLKDMIAIGGMKVFPAEVERVLRAHAAVADAAVVGFPDAVFGEKVVAFIVPVDVAPAADELQAYCKEQLAAYKVPRQFVEADELPRNPTGKVLKTKLRESDLPATGKPVSEDGALESEPEPAAREVPVLGPLTVKLRGLHPGSRLSTLTAFLQDELCEVIGCQERLDPTQPLVEAGLDSLGIVELRDRLQVQFGSHIELSATLVFDYPRINDLAKFFCEAIDAGTGTPHEASPAAGAADDAGQPDALPPEADLSAEIESMSDRQALQELLREIDE